MKQTKTKNNIIIYLAFVILSITFLRYTGKKLIIRQHFVEATQKKKEMQFKINTEKGHYLKIVNTGANALKPLKIKTYDGYDQPMHPDVVYINNGFHGFKYWMAYTSYPYSMGNYENPCVAVSNDGISWISSDKLRNPIVPPPKDVNKGGHYSDTDILYDNKKLDIYYVYNKEGVLGPSKFYRSVSSDGIKWTKPQLVYQCNGPISGYSPAIIKDNNIYKMWYISEGNVLSYVSSKNNMNWSKRKICKIYIPGWTIWHLDVAKTDVGYEGLLCARDNKSCNTALFYIKSTDGLKWSSSNLPVIYPSAKGWDSMDIYRSTLLKQNGLYKIWYSACNFNEKWGIGYTCGREIEKLKG
jgi:hypothetical protein